MSDQRTDFSGAKILMVQQRGWARTVGHHIAERLHAEGARLAALTIKPTTHEFISNQTTVPYEHIFYGDAIKDDPDAFLDGEDIRLETVCEALGVASVWPLIQGSRNHVKSYRQKFYYGFIQQASDEEIESYIKANFKHIREIVSTFEPDVIVCPTFSGLQQIMLNLYANKKGIRSICTIDAKIGKEFIFSHHYLALEGPLPSRLQEMAAGARSENADAAKQHIDDFRRRFRETADGFDIDALSPELTVRGIVGRLTQPFRGTYAYYRSQGWQDRSKKFDITVDHVPPRFIFRDAWQSYRNLRGAMNFPYAKLSDVQEFAYLPLQVQPETTIDIHAPHFNNQLEVARQIAMSMPGDLTLVVKDHPSMRQLRPKSYLRKLAGTPNVKLIDSRIPTPVVLNRAKIVVSPSSTTLAEASFMGVPGIQLGDLGTIARLPNITKHDRFTDLADCIGRILSEPFDRAAHDRQLINYVSAAMDVGLGVNYAQIWGGTESGDLNHLWGKYRAEIFSALNYRDQCHTEA